MTPTIATIAVCAAAEILPAPIAALVIDTISTRMETKLDRVVAEVRRLKAERDAELARIANEANELRRMRLFDMGGPIASLASTTTTDFKTIVIDEPGGPTMLSVNDKTLVIAHGVEVRISPAQFLVLQNSDVSFKWLGSDFDAPMFEAIARNDPHMRRG